MMKMMLGCFVDGTLALLDGPGLPPPERPLALVSAACRMVAARPRKHDRKTTFYAQPREGKFRSLKHDVI